MISHKYKCIFVHIPRTAGTAIEKWICGDDWWYIEKETKHLLASQAKKIYREYWDSYFKFSFVRNPWDRMVSCLGAYEDFFKISYNNFLNFDGYKKEFGYPVTIENDYRFSKRNEILLEKHQEHCVYLNILDEKLDFIGRFESLQKDTEFIKDRLKIEKDFPFKVKEGASKRKNNYQDYYDKKAREDVENLFGKDLKKFGYKFNNEPLFSKILGLLRKSDGS
jgi:hypothetical protein